MTKGSQASKDPDILASMKALRRAAKRAYELGLETNTPVYVLRRGKIVDLTKERRKHDKRKRRWPQWHDTGGGFKERTQP